MELPQKDWTHILANLNVTTAPDTQQTDRLSECLTGKNKQASDYRQQRDVEATAESHKWDDEGDDEDDEAYDHQSGDCLGPCWKRNPEDFINKLYKDTM